MSMLPCSVWWMQDYFSSMNDRIAATHLVIPLGEEEDSDSEPNEGAFPVCVSLF